MTDDDDLGRGGCPIMMTVHSGAASGLRTLLAKVIISAAVLELEPP